MPESESESESESGSKTVTAAPTGGERYEASKGVRLYEGEDFDFLASAEGGDKARTAADAVRLPPERLREGA